MTKWKAGGLESGNTGALDTASPAYAHRFCPRRGLGGQGAGTRMRRTGALKRVSHRKLSFCCASVLSLVLLLFASGCMELETRIKLNEDGSAVVTERLEILRPLREIEAGVQEGLEITFDALLSRQRAEASAREMGPGVTLVSHKLENRQGGSRQSIAVYQVPDITKLTYMSPFFMRGECLGKMRIGMHPQYVESNNSKAGTLYLNFDHIDDRAKPTPLLAELTGSGESPLVRQRYRDVAPILRDFLKGFKVRVVFENYGEILGTEHLFWYDRPRELAIVNYAYGGEAGGKTGTHPLDDEEVVVDLAKLLLAKPNDPWCRRKAPFLGKYAGRNQFRAIIRPSQPLFDKYFKGKELSFSQGHGRPMLKRMASFSAIGETPENQRQSTTSPTSKE